MIYTLDNSSPGRVQWNEAASGQCAHNQTYVSIYGDASTLHCVECWGYVKPAAYAIGPIGFATLPEAASAWTAGDRIVRQDDEGNLEPLSEKELNEALKTVLRNRRLHA